MCSEENIEQSFFQLSISARVWGGGQGRVWDIKYLCEVATGGERQSDPGILTNTEYNTISSQTCRIKVMFDNFQTPTGNAIWRQRSLKLHINVLLESVWRFLHILYSNTPNLIKLNIVSMTAAAKSRSTRDVY